MPSGPSHWHEHWGHDGRAWEYLAKRGFKDRAGMIYHPDRDFEPDHLDMAAIDYLFAEWDYAYAGKGNYPDDARTD